MSRLMVAAVGLAFASPAAAQSPAPPPPALPSVQLPNLMDGQPYGDERKYFVFHQPGLSLDQARADFRHCFRYALITADRQPTNFYASETPPSAYAMGQAAKPPEYSGGNYGLVGLGIASIIDGPLERSRRQMNMMRCMLPRGYHRYRVSEHMWKSLNGNDLAAAVEVQARIASGPVPVTPKVIQ